MAALALPSICISDTQKVSTPSQLNVQNMKKTPKTPIIQHGNFHAKPLKPNTVYRTNRKLSILILDPNDKVNPSPKLSLPSSLRNNRIFSNKERRQKSEDKEKEIGNRTTSLKRNVMKKVPEDGEDVLGKTLSISQYKNWEYMKEYLGKHRKKAAENQEQEKIANDRKFGSEFSSRVMAAKRKYIASLEREQNKETSLMRLRPVDSDLARTEETLFFNTLEDYVNDKTNSLSFVEKTQSQNTEPKEEENGRRIIKRGRNMTDKNLWLDKTNQLTQEIKELTSRPNKAKELIDFSQETVQDQTNRIKIRYDKINQNSGSKGPELAEADKKEAMRDAMEWNSKIFSVFRSTSTRSKRSTAENKAIKKDRQQFFHMMIFREQKAAHKTLMQALDPKPRSKKVRNGERDLFNEFSGSVMGKFFVF